MGKTKDISPKIITSIEALLKHSNHSMREIGRQLRVSPATVSRIAKKLSTKTPLTSNRKGKCGRKRLISAHDSRAIVRLVKANRKASLSFLLGRCNEAGIKISERTLRRHLVSTGFKARRPRKKPLLTPAMVRKRVNWAKKYRNWSVIDWDKVVFSDESTFCILDDRAQFVRRRPGEELDSSCIVSTVKHPTFVMIWSCISSKGVGRLYIVEGTMRQDQYKKVLQTRLIPQLKEWFGNSKDFTFMHDRAPCHMAKSIKAFLSASRIPVLDWPGNSPDMNPIENLWAIVKKRMSRIRVTNRNDLICRLIEVWHKDPEVAQVAKNCISSMPRRIQNLLELKGQRTKY
jgi:DNA-binding MarR family transcriptional regulator